jgi:Concanavalin A-like lectin/glucanases superfamily
MKKIILSSLIVATIGLVQAEELKPVIDLKLNSVQATAPANLKMMNRGKLEFVEKEGKKCFYITTEKAGNLYSQVVFNPGAKSFTVEAEVMPDKTTNGWAGIATLWKGASFCHLRLYGTKSLNFAIVGPNKIHIGTSIKLKDLNLFDGKWHKIAGVIDQENKQVRVYIDGKEFIAKGKHAKPEEVTIPEAKRRALTIGDTVPHGRTKNYRGGIANVKYYIGIPAEYQKKKEE